MQSLQSPNNKCETTGLERHLTSTTITVRSTRTVYLHNTVCHVAYSPALNLCNPYQLTITARWRFADVDIVFSVTADQKFPKRHVHNSFAKNASQLRT